MEVCPVMDGMMATTGLSGLLVFLAVAALLVLLVLGGVWLSRQLRSQWADPATVDLDPATDRLRQRFAAGEIDEEEYERRLSALTHRR